MKTAISKSILLAAYLLVAISSFAQKGRDDDHENFFRIGAKAGVNINKISGKSYKQGFKYNFQAGGFMQFNFSRTFGLQPEVNFVQSESEFSNDPNSVTDDLFLGGTQHKAKLNYLEIPLLLNINVGPSKRVKLQLGPAYGGLLKQTTDKTTTGAEIYKKAEWSAIGGVWFQLPLINISARYKLGLTNVNNLQNTEEWKNQAIQVGIGITL